ncbi:hypothetical protein [Hahella sp. CCB-MM4]|uniref:hypothetical protein n=1 Tax=Hahella sp. (strain CCB-MM4) TaxID=1926491 RepID=UPI001AF01EA7|nr:hypothetical protein [Hahella sp. CCB-MM4]
MKDQTNYVAEYKSILNDVINERPSGTRQRLAEALNKNRSFISQITNPGYSTPIPVKHLEIIFDICVFSPNQKEQFLDLYHKAHPKRVIAADGEHRMRKISVNMPHFKDEAANKLAEKLLQQYADGMSKLIETLEK